MENLYSTYAVPVRRVSLQPRREDSPRSAACEGRERHRQTRRTQGLRRPPRAAMSPVRIRNAAQSPGRSRTLGSTRRVPEATPEFAFGNQSARPATLIPRQMNIRGINVASKCSFQAFAAATPIRNEMCGFLTRNPGELSGTARTYRLPYSAALLSASGPRTNGSVSMKSPSSSTSTTCSSSTVGLSDMAA